MSVKAAISLTLLMMAGCKSTPPEHLAQCQVRVDFAVAPSVDSRDIIDFDKIQAKVKKRYDKKHEKAIGLFLVKAYVRPDHYILKATAVIAQPQVDAPTTYYRSSVIDANLANMDDEHQAALNEAVLNAIEKAVDSHQESCSKQV